MFGFKVINQYEQGIVFRFGKMQPPRANRD
jgi:regulator of protease activity HflC (stomatin/prohibitin superfamily)